MIEVKTPFEILPKFFGLLPESSRSILESQISDLAFALQKSHQRLSDLYESFFSRGHSTLLPLYGLDNALGLGAWPTRVQNILLPILPNYLAARGTRKGFEMAIAALLGLRSDEFKIRERQLPMNIVTTESLLVKHEEQLFLGRYEEEAFAVTFSFAKKASAFPEEYLSNLNEFLEAELPLGIRFYMEFDCESL